MPGMVFGKNRMGYEFSQSAIGKFRQCPEQARRIWMGEVDDFPGDKALRGIIAHAGISDWLIHEDVEGVSHAMEEAWQEEMMTGHPDIKHESLGEAAEAMQLWLNAYPMMGFGPLQDVRTEQMFTLELRPGLSIRGSRDVVHRHGVIDWKFSQARHWFTEAWRHKRYDVQPTVYLAALSMETGIPIERLTFHYAVVSDREFKVIEVRRTQNDVKNLLTELESIVTIIEAMPDGPWPTNSNDWHCGKWCPVFMSGQCMGEFPPSWVASHKDPEYVNLMKRNK